MPTYPFILPKFPIPVEALRKHHPRGYDCECGFDEKLLKQIISIFSGIRRLFFFGNIRRSEERRVGKEC